VNHEVFDMQKQPLSQEHIDLLRDKAQAEKTKTEALLKKWNSACLLLFAVSVVASTAYVAYTYDNKDRAIASVAAMLIVAVIPYMIGSAGASTLTGMLSMTPGITFSPMIIMAMPNPNDAVKVICAITMVVIPVMIAIALIDLYAKKIMDPLSESTSLVSSLEPMSPEHCPEMLAWCRQDNVLTAYQSAVAAHERLFAAGEYSAAKNWVETEEARTMEKNHEEKIRQACLALREPLAQARG